MLLVAPAFKGVMDSARTLVAMEHMRGMVIGMQGYAVANRDWLPPGDSDWQALVTPFVPPEQPQTAESEEFLASRYKAKAQRFAYIPPGRLRDVSNPPATVLLHEVPAALADPTKGVLVAFADGSVRVLSITELQAALATRRPMQHRRLKPGPLHPKNSPMEGKNDEHATGRCGQQRLFPGRSAAEKIINHAHGADRARVRGWRTRGLLRRGHRGDAARARQGEAGGAGSGRIVEPAPAQHLGLRVRGRKQGSPAPRRYLAGSAPHAHEHAARRVRPVPRQPAD